jgi:hypothetical protein
VKLAPAGIQKCQKRDKDIVEDGDDEIDEEDELNYIGDENDQRTFHNRCTSYDNVDMPDSTKYIGITSNPEIVRDRDNTASDITSYSVNSDIADIDIDQSRKQYIVSCPRLQIVWKTVCPRLHIGSLPKIE